MLYSIFPDTKNLHNFLLSLVKQHDSDRKECSPFLLPSDDEAYKTLLHECLVVPLTDTLCPGENIAPTPSLVLDKEVRYSSQESVVNNVIRLLLHINSKYRNVLTFGYIKSSAYSHPHSNKGIRGVYNIASLWPNTLVTFVKRPEWDTLLSRIGDDVMRYLLKDCMMFAGGLENKCHMQISGPNVFYMVDTSANVSSFSSSFSSNPFPLLPKTSSLSRHKKQIKFNRNINKDINNESDKNDNNVTTNTVNDNNNNNNHNENDKNNCNANNTKDVTENKSKSDTCINSNDDNNTNNSQGENKSRKRKRLSQWRRRRMKKRAIRENFGSESKSSCGNDSATCNNSNNANSINDGDESSNAGAVIYSEDGCRSTNSISINVGHHSSEEGHNGLKNNTHSKTHRSDRSSNNGSNINESNENRNCRRDGFSGKQKDSSMPTTNLNKAIPSTRIYYSNTFSEQCGLPSFHILNQVKNSNKAAKRLTWEIFLKGDDTTVTYEAVKNSLRIPRRLQKVVGIMKKFIERHKKNDYRIPLERWCPIRSTLSVMYCKKTDSFVSYKNKANKDGISEIAQNSLQANCNSQADKNTPESNKSVNLDDTYDFLTPGRSWLMKAKLRRDHIKTVKPYTSLLFYYCPYHNVSTFVKSVCAHVIPSVIWGSDDNFSVFVTNVKKLVQLRQFEKLSVKHLLQGMKLKDMEWLSLGTQHKNSYDTQKRTQLLASWMYWLFTDFIIPLLKTNFYITETQMYKKKIFYYRKPVWALISNQATNEIIKKGTFTEISKEEAQQIINNKEREFGYAVMRFVPRSYASGVRCITNFKRKPSDTAFNCLDESSKKKYSVNRKLQFALRILTLQKSYNPHLFGSSVFGRDEIYEKFALFVQRVKGRIINEGLKIYLCSVDVTRSFDTLPQDKILQAAKELLYAGRSDSDSSCDSYRQFADESMNQEERKDYIMMRYNVLTPSPYKKKVCKSYKTHPIDLSASTFTRFYPFAKQISQNFKSAVFIDTVPYVRQDSHKVFNMLKEHILNNVVFVAGRYLKQTVGIPQGSIVSTLLCNLNYGRMERQYLSFFLENNIHSNTNNKACSFRNTPTNNCISITTNHFEKGNNSNTYHSQTPIINNSSGHTQNAPKHTTEKTSKRKLADDDYDPLILDIPPLKKPKTVTANTSSKHEKITECNNKNGNENNNNSTNYDRDESEHNNYQRRPPNSRDEHNGNKEEMLLMRLVDDFLFLTTSQEKATLFLSKMLGGFPEYGCHIGTKKTALNFDFVHQHLDDSNNGSSAVLKRNLYIDPSGNGHIRWCGLLINCENLDVMIDYTRYFGLYLANDIYVDYGSSCGTKLKQKLKDYLRAKCHAILLDANINTLQTIYINIFQAFLFCGIKFYCYAKCLPVKLYNNPNYCLEVLQEIVEYCNILVRFRKSSATEKMHFHCPVTSYEVNWLGYYAFHKILQRKQSNYQEVVCMLSRIVHSSNYVSTKKKLLQIVSNPNNSKIFDNFLF